MKRFGWSAESFQVDAVWHAAMGLCAAASIVGHVVGCSSIDPSPSGPRDGGGASGAAGSSGAGATGGNTGPGGSAGSGNSGGSSSGGSAGGAGSTSEPDAGGTAGTGGNGVGGAADDGGATSADGAGTRRDGATGDASTGGNPRDAGVVDGAGRDADATPPSSGGGLHVSGHFLYDGDGKQVVMRGPELVLHWGVYSGLTSDGVDVPWEGGSNNNVGSATLREIGKTKANALRVYGGIGNSLEAILSTAIVEQKMWVGVGRVDWANPDMKATLQKYAKYVMLHPRGEFTHRDAALWRTEALKVVKYIRSLGYTSPIEIGTTGYGQTWSTIAMYGKEVADSDPLKNTLFLLQLYSEYAKDVPGTLNQVAAFPTPVNVDSCLFTSTYGNTPNTYKEVWDQTLPKNIGSFYWDWWGDGEGNSMTNSGTVASLNAIGQYIANDSPAALKNTVKTPYLLAAHVP